MQKIITEKIGGRVIVLLQGDVNLSDARLARKLNSPQHKNQQLNIWVDCSSIDCIKTFGICHFVNQLLLLQGLQVSITLVHVSEQQRQLLKSLRLESRFTIVADLEKAYTLAQAS